MFPLVDRHVGAPRSEDPMLIIRVITFEVTQPMDHKLPTLQIDRRMNRQLMITVPCFVLRALHGKKTCRYIKVTKLCVEELQKFWNESLK